MTGTAASRPEGLGAPKETAPFRWGDPLNYNQATPLFLPLPRGEPPRSQAVAVPLALAPQDEPLR